MTAFPFWGTSKKYHRTETVINRREDGTNELVEIVIDATVTPMSESHQPQLPGPTPKRTPRPERPTAATISAGATQQRKGVVSLSPERSSRKKQKDRGWGLLGSLRFWEAVFSFAICAAINFLWMTDFTTAAGMTVLLFVCVYPLVLAFKAWLMGGWQRADDGA